MENANNQLGIIANVTGRVQGVGFRYYTQLEADKLGLSGTVQNLSDGSVSLKAFGKSDDVKALINWCKQGPESSDVQSLEFQFIGYMKMDGFVILR
jgi:acylphosphatase